MEIELKLNQSSRVKAKRQKCAFFVQEFNLKSGKKCKLDFD